MALVVVVLVVVELLLDGGIQCAVDVGCKGSQLRIRSAHEPWSSWRKITISLKKDHLLLGTPTPTIENASDNDVPDSCQLKILNPRSALFSPRLCGTCNRSVLNPAFVNSCC